MPRLAFHSLGAVLVVLVLTACADRHEAVPPAAVVRLTSAFPSLSFERPLGLVAPNDSSGRLFVVEQGGRVHVFPERSDVTSRKVFLDISLQVRREHNEEGLLALAFHPDYARNGFFYVYYSASDPLRNVLSRFHVSPTDPDRADPSTEQVVLEIPKPFGNHNGATLLFGPDGDLYVSVGDGGSGGDPLGNGQNLGTLLGKILRLDVDGGGGSAYAIPPDNPFVGRAGARGEIWAYGLRNVWRMSFDRDTGDLWAGDVGQDRWEEIDLVRRGGNYGWNIREGKHPFSGGEPQEGPLLEPIVEYGHDEGASVTGGYVYRGQRLKSLQGTYFYADYVSGTIWGLRYADGRVQSNQVLLDQPKNIASFGENAAGELYVCAFDGKIYRIDAE